MSEICTPLLTLRCGQTYTAPSDDEAVVITPDNTYSDVLRYVLCGLEPGEVKTLVDLIVDSGWMPEKGKLQ